MSHPTSKTSLSSQSSPQPWPRASVATQTVLVTGASGFLGREIVAQLSTQHHKVVTVGRGLGLEASLPNFQRVDLVAEEWPNALLQNVDAIIHCAGLAHQFGKSKTSDASYFDLNLRATERLFERAAACGVKRFVLISSASVYGVCNPTKTEEDTCEPVNAYGESKLAAEEAVLKKAASENIEVVILRLCTLYGPKDPGNVARLIRFMKKAWAVSVGDGENRKSLLHVHDAARACVLAVTASPTLDRHSHSVASCTRVFNVAGEPVRVAELNREICRALGKKSPRKLPMQLVLPLCRLGSWLPVAGKLFSRIGSTLKKLGRDDTIDGKRFQAEYDFAPSIELAAGLRSEVAELKDNRNSWTGKRVFDVFLSICLLFAFSIPIIGLALLVRLTSKGPAIYWSNRVGRHNRIFKMAKFRSMRTEAPQVATHLLGDSSNWITPLGKLMRKTSLDELPQLWNILRGDMSFVGPRPALFNQYDLIALRTSLGIEELVPGVTGWAQINGRDDLLIPEKVAYDFDYLHKKTLWLDLRIILLTFSKTLARDGVRQADEAEDAAKSWTIHHGLHGILAATPTTLAAATLASHCAEQHRRKFGLVCVRDIDVLETMERQSNVPIFFIADADEFPAGSEETNLVVLSSEAYRNLPQRHAIEAMSDDILEQIKSHPEQAASQERSVSKGGAIA